MKLKPQTSTLKSGKIITIRLPRLDEGQHLLDLKRSYIKDTKTIPLTLEEYPSDVKKESRLIDEYLHSANSLLLIAEAKGEFIGNIDLTGSPRVKISHTAMIGMGIKEEWRNQGLGRLFIESVLDWAKIQSDIELVWLDVYASNQLGVHLYQNTRFKVSGVIKDFFKDDNGYMDKIQMYQRIK